MWLRYHSTFDERPFFPWRGLATLAAIFALIALAAYWFS